MGTDLAWEVHGDLCATVQFVISGNEDSGIPATLASGNPTTAASPSNAKPGKIRIKRASALVNEFCPKPEESGKKSEQPKKKTEEMGKKQEHLDKKPEEVRKKQEEARKKQEEASKKQEGASNK